MEKKNIWLAIGIIIIIIAVIYLIARPGSTTLPKTTSPEEPAGEPTEVIEVTEPTLENTTPEAVGQELEELDLGDIDADLKTIDDELKQIEGF